MKTPQLHTLVCASAQARQARPRFTTRDLHALYSKVQRARSSTTQSRYLRQLLHQLPRLHPYTEMAYVSFVRHEDGATVYFPTYEPINDFTCVPRKRLAVATLDQHKPCVLHTRVHHCLVHWGAVDAPSKYTTTHKQLVNTLFAAYVEQLRRGRALSTIKDTAVIDCTEAGTTKAMGDYLSTTTATHTIINWDTQSLATARGQIHTRHCLFFHGASKEYLEQVTPRSLSALFLDWCGSYIGTKCSPRQELLRAFVRQVFTTKESLLAITICTRTSTAKAWSQVEMIQDILEMAGQQGYGRTSLRTCYNYCGGMKFLCFSIRA